MKLHEILAKIDENQQKIDGFGKFDPEILKKINYKFRLDWNYYSNSMEGNSLTKIETKHLMMDVAISGGSFKDIAEMRGHDNEVLEIFKIGKGDLRLSEGRIRDMHKAIMYEDDPQKQAFIGKWKTSDNYLLNYRGERIDFLAHLDVPDAMHNLLNKTNAEIDAVNQHKKDALHPVIIAFQFHLDYIYIHPFYDGNGRTVRLLMNLLLISFGLPPVIIKEKDREAYYKVLAEIQGYGADPKEFYSFMGNLLTESQQLVLDALEGKDIEEEDDFEKEIALIKSKVNTDSVVKSPKTILQVYQNVEKEIWIPLSNIIEQASSLFSEKKINRLINSKPERKMDNSESLLSAVSLVKKLNSKIQEEEKTLIFGYDIYEKDIYSLEWNYCLFGLSGSKRSSNLEIKLQLQFENNTWKLDLLLDYKSLYRIEKNYGTAYLANEKPEIEKQLKTSLLNEIKANQ